MLAGCTSSGPPPPGPRLAIEQTQADLGSITRAKSLTYTFAVRNDGGRVLRLEALRTSCDCSARANPPASLAPGESGTIDLSCDAGPLAGAQRRTVTVYSNDAARPTATLALEADIEAGIAPLQREFYFGRAKPGARTARDIRLHLDAADAAPRQARSLDGHFSARLEQRGDDEWRVALTVAPDAPAGVLRDRIEIDSAGQPALVVPVVGRVEGAS